MEVFDNMRVNVVASLDAGAEKSSLEAEVTSHQGAPVMCRVWVI